MRRCALILLVLAVLLCACSKGTGTEVVPGVSEPPAQAVQNTPDSLAKWSSFDLTDSWNDSAVTVQLSGDGFTSEGAGITQDKDVLTVTEAGTYVLSGSWNGQICVKVDETAKVQLVFNGLELADRTRSPLYCEQADKVLITLASGTVNTVSDQDSDYFEGQQTIRGRYAGAIHAKCPLTVNGAGYLRVESQYRHGIVSDNLRIVSGILAINVPEDGLKGKNALSVRGGEVEITAGKDGLKVTEEKKEDKGYLVIEGGKLKISCEDDGIDVSRTVQMFGGDLQVLSKGHAVKSDGTITVAGNASLLLNANSGKSDSDSKGLSAANDVTVLGGTIRITRSFEGIQSKESKVRIAGGHTVISATDDGINAQTGIEISDGYIFVQASGDGLDSNQDITISGGTTIVQGPTSNGDGPLDCGDFGSSIRVTGGFLLAYGSAGMAHFPTGSVSTQYSMGYVVSLQPDVVYSLRDGDGNAVCTFAVLQASQSLCISSPAIKKGVTYTLYANATPTSEAENGVYANASTGGTELLTFTADTVLSTNQQGGGFDGPGGPGGPGGKPGMRP